MQSCNCLCDSTFSFPRCLTSSSGDDVALQLNALRILEFGKRPKGRLPLPKLEPNAVRHLCVLGYLQASRGHLEKAIECENFVLLRGRALGRRVKVIKGSEEPIGWEKRHL